MATCVISSGWTGPACADVFNVPGIEKDKIYVTNKADIDSYTEAVTGEISAITFEQYKGFYSLEVHKDTASWSEELQVGQNSGAHYQTSLTFRTIDAATSIRNAINDMVGTSLVFAVKDKNGNWYVIGETDGVELSENTKGSGSAPGDDTGDVLTFTGVNRGKVKKFFITDAATTETTIDGYLL